MSALGMASLGTQCQNKALGMASLGVHCVAITAIVEGGGGYISRTVVVPDWDRTKIPYEHLVREDEELIALVIAAVSKGIIP